MLAEITEFVTGVRPPVETDRILTTVMFTDIVTSTEHAATLGDSQWRRLLERHDHVIQRQLDRFRVRQIKHTGDGILASFDGPARGVRCAMSIVDALGAIGLDTRIGLHTGECELRGEDIGGMAVHIAARIAARAGGGEVLVSSTVRDLVAGSSITFEHLGVTELKGVPGKWSLLRVKAS